MQSIISNIETIIEKYKEKTAKECYALIKVEDEIPSLMENKLGGMPYIPKDKQVPRDAKGNYMALLLQVNLRDIDLENFPKKGVLEIFISTEIGYPQEYKIIIFEDDLHKQHL